MNTHESPPATGQSRNSEQDLLDAIDNELAGRPVYSPQNEDVALMDRYMAAQQLGDELDRRGIDLSETTDNAEVRRLLMDGVLYQGGDKTSDQQYKDVEAANAAVLKAHREEGKPLPAPNGKPSNLNERQWILVRTPNFKRWFGDWEAAEKQRQLDALIDEAVSATSPTGKMVLRPVTPEEVAEIKRQGGPDVSGMSHEITAEELRHALNQHGQPDEASRQPSQRPLTKGDLGLVAAVLDAPTEITVQLRGKNKTSVVYGRDFGNGKIEYVERVFETSRNNKPRLTLRTIWVRRAATGVKSNPTRVSTPYRNSSVLFANGRVNPDTASKVIDENGEPQVVYHGTQAEKPDASMQFVDDPINGGRWVGIASPSVIESFKQGAGYASWFTDAENASAYADNYLGKRGLPVVYPVFLNLKNVEAVDAQGRDFTNPEGTDFNDGRNDINDIAAKAKKAGKHGLIIENVIDNAEPGIERAQTSYASFHPNQIKSATGNVGTFDEGNNDILKQGGETPRAQIAFGERDTSGIRPFNIDLLKGADRSSFIHELGHYIFEVMGDYASRSEASPGIKAELQNLLDTVQTMLDEASRPSACAADNAP